MEESSVYQALIRRGLERGRIEGRAAAKAEAVAEGMQLALIIVLEHRFGGVWPHLDARIRATTDPTQLLLALRQVISNTRINEVSK